MLSALKEVISPKVVIDFFDDKNQKCLILKEDGEKSKIKELWIRAIPEQAFAFTLDFKSSEDNKCKCFTQLSSYLNSTNDIGINKSCDLVIVAYLKNKWVVILLDLKSQKIDYKKTELQLHNSELFIKYIINLIKYYYPENLKSNVLSLYCQKVIVKTGVKRNTVHKPNKNQIPRYAFHQVSLSKINNGKASVYLERLINLKSTKPTKL